MRASYWSWIEEVWVASQNQSHCAVSQTSSAKSLASLVSHATTLDFLTRFPGLHPPAQDGRSRSVFSDNSSKDSRNS